jgi:uncharacterized membrane protein
VTRRERVAIARAIAAAEQGTTGRIAVRIVPEGAVDPFDRATHEFARVGLHRHESANAALILVAPKARSFAVIGDRALHERVGDEFWSEVVRVSQPYFARGALSEGVIVAVVRVGEALKTHFPCA